MLVSVDAELCADQRINFAAIPVELLGQVSAAIDGAPAVCPECGGDLDFCQPNLHDGSGAELVGSCVECERLSYVVELFGSAVVTMLLPRRADIAPKAVASLASLREP